MPIRYPLDFVDKDMDHLLNLNKVANKYFFKPRPFVFISKVKMSAKSNLVSRDFLGNTKNFRLVRTCINKLLLYGNHPNDSLRMKIID